MFSSRHTASGPRWLATQVCLDAIGPAERKTHINGLDILAIPLAARRWGGRLAGSRVMLLVDNTAALAVARIGPSAASDFAQLSSEL